MFFVTKPKFPDLNYTFSHFDPNNFLDQNPALLSHYTVKKHMLNRFLICTKQTTFILYLSPFGQGIPS